MAGENCFFFYGYLFSVTNELTGLGLGAFSVQLDSKDGSDDSYQQQTSGSGLGDSQELLCGN